VKRIRTPVAGLVAFALSFAAAAAEPSQPAAQFKELCGMCHQTNGMGVGILARRPGDTSKGLLEDRTDISAAFVKVVVRNGIVNMPRISRGEVSDAQLDAIASYLSKGKP
jgi:mono/diheme cytochrome c family protein